jgi:LmbE family N-acetylglucosaminyl deacetylase
MTMARVLVLSPHPDDETLGCGGSLCGHVAAGDEVRVVFLTSGELGDRRRDPAQTGLVREEEAAAATAILGVQHIEFWREPDQALRAGTDLVRRLAALLEAWQPQWVYTTHPQESHPDHRAVPRLLRRALAGAQVARPRVLLFEIWTPLQRIQHIVDVSAWMQTKLRAVRAYRSQCELLRFDEAVAGLNRYRGEMHSWPGGDYAEVFGVMKS